VLAVAVLYAVLALAMVGPALLPGRTLSASDDLWAAAPWQSARPSGVHGLGTNFELGDSAAQFQPFLQYTRSRLPDTPLWNPYVEGGRPYLANAQSAVFSPFSAPAYVLPFWRSLGVIAALKLWMAAFGTFLLGRALGMRFAGALLAGVAFAFGLPMLVWLAWPLTSVWAFLPWVLLMTELVVRNPRVITAAGLALAVALQFLGGHPESSFHTMFGATAFLVLRLAVHRRRGLAATGRSIAGFALGAAAGAGLAALTLVPFLELLSHSNDAAHRAALPPSTISPRYVLGLLLPNFWGRPPGPEETFFINHPFYLGTITILLAGAALILRPTAERLAVAVFAAWALAVILGVQPILRLVDKLPGFHTAHNPRMTILVAMCGALLAGWGLSELAGDRLRSRRAQVVVGASAALWIGVPLALAVAGRLPHDGLRQAFEYAWGFVHPPRRVPKAQVPHALAVLRLRSVLEWLVLAGAVVLLLLLRKRGTLSGHAFSGLAVALLVVDLFKVGMGYNPAIPIAHASQPPNATIRYLQSRRPGRFVGLPPVRHKVLLSPIPPNVAMRYGLYDARGYDFPVDSRFDALWRRTVYAFDYVPITTVTTMAPSARRTFDLLSVDDVVQDPHDRPLHVPGWRLVRQGPEARVYANERALPRAFVVAGQRVVGGEEGALAAVTAPGFAGRREAVTERPIPGLPRGPRAPAGSARLRSYAPERLSIEAHARRPGLVVLTDLAYPGWRAEVDGHPAPLRRVDYLLRGVSIPAGTHSVEMTYEPASWRAGWIVSLVTALGLAGAVAWELRRRRTRGRAT
jgi:hypothetical protein